MLIEIVKDIRWLLFIMFIGILATWNAFILLLKTNCQELNGNQTCEIQRSNSVTFMIRALYDAVNRLLFGEGDSNSLENTDHFGLVIAIYMVSMTAVPIILLNMLVAIMGKSFERIEVRFHCSWQFLFVFNFMFDSITGAISKRGCFDESQYYSCKWCRCENLVFVFVCSLLHKRIIVTNINRRLKCS
jgi:hypothetical protein